MEAVTAYLIVLVCLVGQSVHIVRLLHGHAPAGIEYRYHGYAGHDGHAAADAHKVGGIVERSERNAVLNCLKNFVVDEDRIIQLLAAMEHAMAHRVYLTHVLYYADLGIRKNLQNHGDSVLVVLHILLLLALIALGGLVGDHGAGYSYALTDALCYHAAVIEIYELILQGRAACVDYENFHLCFSSDNDYIFCA